MVGQAEIILPARKKALTVPAAALVSDGAERYVLVDEGSGQYVRQNVVVGRQARGLVEVRRGQIVPTDRVVTAGSHELATFFIQGSLRLSPEAAENIGLDPRRDVRPAGLRPLAEVAQLSAAVELPPDRKAVVSSPLTGTVRRILVDRDETVRAGQVVAEVGSLELLTLQLDLLRSHLQLQLLEETLKRLRPLAQNSVVPMRQLRETERSYNAALLQRDSARRKLEAAGLAAGQVDEVLATRKPVEVLPLRAPVGGAVVRFRAVLGQAVKADEPLFEVHDLSGALLHAHVTERQLPAVRHGQPARARLLSDAGWVGDAEVVRTGPVFAGDNRTLSVWAELKQPPPGLLEGMLARLTLVVAEPPRPVLAVERTAVLREGSQEFVFVRRGDGTYERRAVRTGRGDDEFIEVRQGLDPGEEVATRGVHGLQTAYAAVR
jgi:RND family efflux transporter MFP subunit